MDVFRPEFARRRRIKTVAFTTGGLLLLTAGGFGISRLKPAAPTVERSTVWIDHVQRGSFNRQVRGLGTLVPERILVIPANMEGRITRRFVLPGASVSPDMTILEMSNPKLEQDLFEAVSQLKGAEADYANLKAQLESQKFQQEATAAEVESDYQQAQVQYDANQQLSAAGIVDKITLRKSEVAADQLRTRRDLERRRVVVHSEVIKAQLAAQEAKAEQLRGLVGLRKAQIDSLRVRAGISGVLQRIEVEVGQLAPAGSVLARVSDPSLLKAELKVPETQAKDIWLKQTATIDTHNGVVPGHVVRIDPAVKDGTVTVDVSLDGKLPAGARPDLSVEGIIELERLENVLFVGRPVMAQPHAAIGLFKLEPDGTHADRAAVRIGRMSVNTVEIEDGLKEGDQVILSDMSAWDGQNRIRLK